jgi:hypothetical protein
MDENIKAGTDEPTPNVSLSGMITTRFSSL